MKLKHLIRPYPLAATLLLAFSGPFTAQAADYASTVLSNAPLAYWRFNEAAASPALNKTTNSSSMGSILDGYVVADAMLGQPGIVGNSVLVTNSCSAPGCCSSKIDFRFNVALNTDGAFSID